MISPNVIGIGRPEWPRKTRDNTCERCDGRGYTRKTAPVVKTENKKLVTVSLGSGCPGCSGRGVIGER